MKPIHVTVAQLETLVAIAETGSFTAAGEQLGLTQSAVSHAVNHLEAVLDVKLFERSRHGVVLTDIGANVLIEAHAALAQLEHLQEMVADFKGFTRGTLRVGSFTSVATQLLPQALQAFQTTYPEIDIMLREGTDDEVKTWLREHVIDVGVVIMPSDEFETFPLAMDQLCLVLPAAHPLAAYSELALHQIADEPFIMSEGGCEGLIRSAFSRVGLTPNTTYRIRDIGTIFSFVRSGLGLTMVPSLSISGSLEGLAVIKLVPPVHRQIAFAMRSTTSRSAIAAHFIKQAQHVASVLVSSFMPAVDRE